MLPLEGISMSEKHVTWESIAGKPRYPKTDDEAVFLAEKQPLIDGNGYILEDETGQAWALWFTQIKPIAVAMKGKKRVHVKFEQDPMNERYTVTTVVEAK